MKPGPTVFFFAGALLVASVSTGEPPTVITVTEIQDEGAGLDPALPAMLTDRVRAAITEGGVFLLETPEEAGRASKTLSTSIVRPGVDCVVASSLYDHAAKKIEVTAQEHGPCTAEGLEESIRNVAFRIVFMAGRDRNDKQVEIKPSAELVEKRPVGAPPPLRAKSEVSVGPVSDVLLAVGFSTNRRTGLEPKHASDTEYGLRIDGRFFLGPLVENRFLKGIGVGGYFNTVFDLMYGIPGGDTWGATQNQWQVEAQYRFTLDEVLFKPTFMLRAGYGETSCIIGNEHPLALSVSYGYPYAAFDFYLMLLDPFIRVNFSVGYLFALDLGEDLSGSGSGYTARGGIDLALFGHLHVGWGMEWLRFSIDDENRGGMWDSYDGMFLRVGWGFR